MLGELIANGRTSEVYRYGLDGAAKVLKASTPPTWASVEASITDSVRRLGVPAAEVRDVVEIDGRAAVIFERIDGPSMWQRMLDTPADIEPLVLDLVAVQNAIHAAGVPDALPGLVDRLRAKLTRAPQLSADEIVRAHTLLDQLPIGSALLHGDLHPGNVLLGNGGMVVIDWFDAAVGHPLGDVARTMLLLQGSGATDLRHLPGTSIALAERVHDAYVRTKADGVADDAMLESWIRLRAAGRLAEQTDADVSGLLSMWRAGLSGVDDNAAE